MHTARTFFVVLMIFICNIIVAQHIRFNWHTCLENQYLESGVLPVDIVSTGDGYLIISDYDNPNFAIPPGMWQMDLWLTKIDLMGTVMWSKFICGTNNDSPVRIIPTSDSNYYILGGTASGDGDITFDPYPNANNFWVIKIDGNGNKIWDKVVGGNIWDIPSYATRSPDGGIVAIGQTQSSDGDVSFNFGYWDIWAIKIDSLGNIIWDCAIGSSGGEFSGGIINTTDGGYLICGYGRNISSNGNITCIPHSSDSEALLVKINDIGQIQWQMCYGGSDHDVFTNLLETIDGYIIFGSTSSSDGDLSGLNYHYGLDHLGNRTSDYWIMKTDFLGNIVWQKCFGGSDNEYSSRIIELSNKDIVLFGTTESMDGDIVGSHSIYQGFLYKDISMLKLSSTGEYKGQRCIGSRSDEHFKRGVLLINDSTYVLTSQFFIGSNGDIECGSDPNIGGKFKLWVTQFTDSILMNNIHEKLGHWFNIHPNPAADYLVVEDQKSTNCSLIICSFLGQTLEEFEIKYPKTLINLSHFENGLYLYIYKFGNRSTSGKLVIQR